MDEESFMLHISQTCAQSWIILLCSAHSLFVPGLFC